MQKNRKFNPSFKIKPENYLSSEQHTNVSVAELEFKFREGKIYKQCIWVQTQKITLVYLLYCIFLLGIHLHMNNFLIKNSFTILIKDFSNWKTQVQHI